VCTRRSEAAVRGASVLELGAGTGACGLYASGLGASRVLLTDGSEGLLRLLQANLANNLPLLPPTKQVAVERLLWGDDAPPPPGPWDLVLGSDLTYADAHEARAPSALAPASSPPLPRPPRPWVPRAGRGAPPFLTLAASLAAPGAHGDARPAADAATRRRAAAARGHVARAPQAAG